ncbi:hypothetical protein PHMEG_000183 [Phytophthora megakarya]|uniref:Uncharacterized protein n=1 Tax=Phytophthora megakarya TaxID=4795 RepID=A0A225X3T0_9STRA|nr:hypothetical protein PHMEG_000183 [Phytophthora megakarya]
MGSPCTADFFKNKTSLMYLSMMPPKSKQCIIFTTYDGPTRSFYLAASAFTSKMRKYGITPAALLHDMLLAWTPIGLYADVFNEIPNPECSIAMQSEVWYILTVIPQDKITRPGMKWMKARIGAECVLRNITISHMKWSRFWEYFTSTWITTFAPRL